MSAEDTAAAPDDNVLMSREDFIKLGNAMQQYKEIEMKYLASQQRGRVTAALLVADVILFASLWLGFVDWEVALASAGLVFAGQETFLALATAIRGIVRRA